jgi:hypothetical protein
VASYTEHGASSKNIFDNSRSVSNKYFYLQPGSPSSSFSSENCQQNVFLSEFFLAEYTICRGSTQQ